MIRDRGNIKWQGMMLPEHTKEINAWLNEDHYTERPALDEWDLQTIQCEIEVASKRQCVTNVKYWENGKVILYSGIIAEINSQMMCISVESLSGRDNLSMIDIVSVHIAE